MCETQVKIVQGLGAEPQWGGTGTRGFIYPLYSLFSLELEGKSTSRGLGWGSLSSSGNLREGIYINIHRNLLCNTIFLSGNPHRNKEGFIPIFHINFPSFSFLQSHFLFGNPHPHKKGFIPISPKFSLLQPSSIPFFTPQKEA